MTGDNGIKIANSRIYILTVMLLFVIMSVIYSAILPAIKNHEWVKILIFAALLLLVFNIIRMRFKTVPLSIVFAGNEVKIKTLLGVKYYQLGDIIGLEYSEMGRMQPRHFLVFTNGDIYDIVARKSAETIEEYIKERKY